MDISYMFDVIVKICAVILLLGSIKIVLYDIPIVIHDIHKCLDRKTMVNEEKRRYWYLKNMERQYDMDEMNIAYSKRGYEYINKNDIKKDL